jgi:geranylgeranyl diphosphate synthase type II
MAEKSFELSLEELEQIVRQLEGAICRSIDRWSCSSRVCVFRASARNGLTKLNAKSKSCFGVMTELTNQRRSTNPRRMTAAETITHYLARRAAEINEWLDRLVPSETTPPERLHKAMRYSLLAGGKRLRPALVLSAGEAFGAETDDLMPAACAIEMIHTYSLIHDDLPAMDNDDLRRGQPTCHKAFGEPIAILAGDALLTQAFRVLAADSPKRDAERQIRVIREVASAAGTVDALIGGQVADIESEGRKVDASTLEYIHHSKTGAMITASVVIGGTVGGASNDQID